MSGLIKYQFHPLELSFVGFSGSGKTTLIEGLLRTGCFANIGYLKHDAHSFQVDREGKDTFRIKAAGARSAFIGNERELAYMASGRLNMFQQKSLFLDCDALFVEGYKALDLDKVVVLDRERTILQELQDYSRVLAFVGEGDAAGTDLPIDRPYFQRDQLLAIAEFIADALREKALRQRPLYGLVLAGGMSSRMGEDKGRLAYHGEKQALHVYRMLQDLGLPSYISLRQGQWSDAEVAGLPVIYDRFTGMGPNAGILSAMLEVPEASWLVVACDLPLLSPDALRHLLKARQVQKMATAYRSVSEPDFPEPLCAIYENPLRMRFFEGMALGLSCPRKVLLQSHTEMLEPFDNWALMNANEPAEASLVRERLRERQGERSL